MPDTSSNILITTNDNTAIIATDYGTSGIGLTAAHISLSKIAYGDESTTVRVNTATPLPVFLYGATAMTTTVAGTVGGTGTFFVKNVAGTYFEIAGTTFSSTLIGITGSVQGRINGYPMGITGSITVPNLLMVQGTTNGILLGITGGRNLNSATDSVGVTGMVQINGLPLIAALNSVAVYGADLGDKVLTRIYGSDGTTLGMVSDALKVSVVNAGITFAVNISATVGVTNATGPLGLKVMGTGVTAAFPIIIQGTAPDGAIEIVSYDELAVSIADTVTIDDSNIVDSLESSSKPLITALSFIRSNTNVISTINDRIANGTIQSKVTEIVRSNAVTHGKKDATTSPMALSSTVTNLKSGVNIKCSSRNTDVVYIGNSKLLTAQGDGYPLDPGESIFIECNSAALVYVKSNTGTQTVHFIAS